MNMTWLPWPPPPEQTEDIIVQDRDRGIFIGEVESGVWYDHYDESFVDPVRWCRIPPLPGGEE